MTSIKFILIAILIAATAACANEESPVGDPSAGDVTLSREAQPAAPSIRNSTSAETTTVAAMDVLVAQHSSLLALSAEEAAWLDRHGYPTAEELEALSTYDIRELENAMRNRRDRKAASLVGHRRMLDGDIHGAASAFAAGADLGSLYARQQLAISTAQSVTGLPLDKLWQADQGNLQVMVAQLEMAKMLGDHRAQSYIDRFTTNFDWQRYGKHVLTQTAEFMRQYGEGARARGERAMGPDPRPNADAWARLQSDPDGLVTVYRRKPTYP